MISSDLDGDGLEELLAGGINNSFRQSTIVVFDPRQVSGASRQPPGDPLQLKGFPAGSEKVVVLFPRTVVNQKFEPMNRLGPLWVADGNIHLTVRERRIPDGGYLAYSLSPSLEVTSIIPSDGLIKLYQDLRNSGQIQVDLFRDELPRLRKLTVLRPPLPTLAAK